jgi:hypothetical protein
MSIPAEPALFTCCDGPHSGVPDDQRPPHWLDVMPCWVGEPTARESAGTAIAAAWAGYGFTAADLAAWIAAGITEPAVAAACRTVGFSPYTDRGFLSGWAERLDLGDATADEAAVAYKGAP